MIAPEGRSQFAVLGKSSKALSEVHLIEYRAELGTIIDLKINTTSDRLYKVGASKPAPGILLQSGKDNQGEFFSISDASLNGFADIATKEIGYRLTKDAYSKKSPINVLSKEYTGFAVTDFVSKHNNPKAVIIGERTIVIRDLPQNRAEGTIPVAREGTLTNLAADFHSDRVDS